MQDRMKVSALQMALLVGSLLIASNMNTMPTAITMAAEQDAWYAYLFPIPYGIGMAYLMWRLARFSPGKNMYEIMQHACGKWLGGLLNGILIVYLSMDLISQLRIYSDFFSSSILLRTPQIYILLMTMLLLVYYAGGSMEHLFRTNVVFVSLFLALYMLTPMFLLNEIDMNKLKPSLSSGIFQPLKGGILAFGSFTDLIIFGAFLHHVRRPRDIYIAMKMGVIYSAFMLTIWLFCVVSVISPILSSRMLYIGWILVQQIHITDFLDRIDLFLISMFVPVLLIKYAALYIAVLTGIASYTKQKKFDFINLPMGIVITILSAITFDNTDEVSVFYAFGLLPISVGVQILFLAGLFIGLGVRKKKSIPSDMKASGYSIGVWLTLAGGIATIISGALVGNQRGYYGSICASLFVIFLVLCVFLSIKEYTTGIRGKV
ncbi:spore germination protein (amino acid permease) [Paenibacillus catalpae]|uniref:Spore germination protein (Amino acid permease) n=1 Tax=Paenibacillus catalpae TaxID=1045775 RepID=A0A1I1X415_9BACL|nr:endospore germination permease [Paenibacillus catalpae]SFE02146.1 spore germination protein (amino acid permease) [Paenibacillus catalpae]